MKIGIVGSGNIGANAARLFVRAGHEVVLSNSRGGKGLEALVSELGGNAKATTIEEAARFGEVVWSPMKEAAANSLGLLFTNKE
jgi:predicted dinucleotide-binding enzyme